MDRHLPAKEAHAGSSPASDSRGSLDAVADDEPEDELLNRRAEKEASEALDGIESVDDLLDAFEITPVVDRIDKGPGRCYHEGFRLDADSRRCYCRKCGQEVDPWMALNTFAGRWERYVQTLADIRRQIEYARDELEQASRLEKNTKARLRKARSSLEREARVTTAIENLLERLDAQLAHADADDDTPALVWARRWRAALAEALEAE